MADATDPGFDVRCIPPTPLDREPWVGIPDAAALAGWGHADEVRYNQNLRYGARQMFFAEAFDFIKENGVDGEYWEFGCHRGRTFRMALSEARRRNIPEMTFRAFDSFEGLPTDSAGHGVNPWQGGALCTSEAEFTALMAAHGLYVDSIRTHKGFYQDSLTPALQGRLSTAGARAAIINIDCDLYESALPIFAFIEPFIQEGTILYIDDYFVGYKGSPRRGVSRAFDDFAKNSRFRFIQHQQVGWMGRSFVAYIDD